MTNQAGHTSRMLWASGEWTAPLKAADQGRWAPGLAASRVPYSSRQRRVTSAEISREVYRHRFRSTRNFERRPLVGGQLERLTQMLQPARDGSPPYASAGALYPVHLYAFEYVDELEANTLYLDNAESCVYEVSKVTTSAVGDAVFETWCWPSGALIAFVIDFRRVCGKYGPRGVRFACIEVGLVSQIARSAAADIGLGTCLVGGYSDFKVIQLLGLDSEYFGVACLLAIGSAQESV